MNFHHDFFRFGLYLIFGMRKKYVNLILSDAYLFFFRHCISLLYQAVVLVFKVLFVSKYDVFGYNLLLITFRRGPFVRAQQRSAMS